MISLLACCALGSMGSNAVAAPESAADLAKDAKRVLRKGSADERRALCSRLLASEHGAAAYGAALEGLAGAQKRLSKATAARDKQGAKMLAYWAKRVSNFGMTRAQYTEYRGQEIENGKLCDAVTRADAERSLFLDAAREIAGRLPAAETPPTAPGDPAEQRDPVAEAVVKRVGRARSAADKGDFVRTIAGPLVPLLKTELHAWARTERARELASAALAVLAEAPDVADIAALAPCAERIDPVVRRHYYRLAGRVRSTAAVDALVTRLASEVGAPAFEIVRELRHLSGCSYGEDARPWQEWWQGRRASWVAEEAEESAAEAFERRENARYFGLKIHSARILFIFDRSYSMDWEVDSRWDEDAREMRSGRGPSKISVAKRELLRAISSLDESTSFNILAYGTELDTFQRRPLPATEQNREKATRWIEKLATEGNTNLSGALLEGMENTRPGMPFADAAIADTLVVMSDGEPNGGPIADSGDTLDEIHRLNADAMVTIHTVFLGIDGDANFMRALAERNGGQFVHHRK